MSALILHCFLHIVYGGTAFPNAVCHSLLVAARNTTNGLPPQNTCMSSFFIYITLTQLVLFDSNVSYLSK